jgi:ribonucleoside-diphosphate reductase alpha chain
VSKDSKPTLGIQRFFSSDIHPFESVEWERRDAIIEGKPGQEPVFKQTGISAPASWSQNATNIVAQKYFAGTLGKEDREWSVKQLIGRVAETITQKGKENGYFDGEDEARTFEYELTYLLVHQMAAFNSPVWFNIGVDKIKQQASACQPYQARVSTPQGLIPIGQLVEENSIGQEVYDATGITTIQAVKANGIKKVIQLQTKEGYQLELTKDHLVFQDSDTKGHYVEAGTLKAKDKLQWVCTDNTIAKKPLVKQLA